MPIVPPFATLTASWSRLCLCFSVSAVVALQAAAASEDDLPRVRYRNGDTTLRAFSAVSKLTRDSIVKLNADGETVALATVITTNGYALTKASELKPGKLTAWLAGGKEVPAELAATDETHDVALVRVSASGLRPAVWSTNALLLGQWAITPGITDTPHAVGVISALPRRIRPPRVYMGVQFDLAATTPIIAQILAGMGAEQAGLKTGDVILSLNGAVVTNREHAVEIIRECREGQSIQVRVRRGEEEVSTEVQLRKSTSGDAVSSLQPNDRTARLSGDVSQRAEDFASVVQHDSVLQPWLCGGPLVNLEGRVIGLNIARAGRVATYALTPDVVKKLLPGLLARAGQGTAPPVSPK